MARSRSSRTCGSPPPTDGLELVGSDLEITNRVQVPAEVEEQGVAVVPKLLGEIVRRLEPGPVTVAVTGDEAVITRGSVHHVVATQARRGLPAARLERR